MDDASTIARALGGKRIGRDWMAKCPAHDERTASLAIRDGATGVLVHCFAGCPQGAVIDALARCGLWDRPRSPSRSTLRPTPSPRPISRPADEAVRIEAARRIWHQAHDPRGTLGERYLNSRELELDEDLAGRVLRFHPACPWGKGVKAPCLVAAFRPVRNGPGEEGPPSAIIRIGLTPEGVKLSKGGDGKRMLGPVGGCAIKLDADEDVTLGLGITEGLETGLAVRATGWRPVWVFGSAGAISKLEPITGVETLTIFADHDATGLGVAQVCAERWQAAGREAFIRWPSGLGHDYADEVSR
jgi:putative DNA primase/helicase